MDEQQQQQHQQLVMDYLRDIKKLAEDLVAQKPTKEWLTTKEAAIALGRAEFTVRQWCRLGRIRCRKRLTGRGPHCAWVIGAEEIRRIEREGLLPLEPTSTVVETRFKPNGRARNVQA